MFIKQLSSYQYTIIKRRFGILYYFDKRFHGHRFTKRTARIPISIVWLISTLISAHLPLGLLEKSDVFRTSQVCIGIPIFMYVHKKATKSNHVLLRVQNEQFSEEKGLILRYTEKEV